MEAVPIIIGMFPIIIGTVSIIMGLLPITLEEWFLHGKNPVAATGFYPVAPTGPRPVAAPIFFRV